MNETSIQNIYSVLPQPRVMKAFMQNTLIQDDTLMVRVTYPKAAVDAARRESSMAYPTSGVHSIRFPPLASSSSLAAPLRKSSSLIHINPLW
mmetsp:Transcript_897/g.1492  ORF Transcript_897/g.1492 Transcript_897/m.1492 type:complete len:92 (-) Transcript_897:15-290(-)